MKLLEFGFRNVFSYGNKLQTFKIKQNEPNLVLIRGRRGAGKSSIKESIILSIYGKCLDHSIGRVPNRANGNAYVYNKYITNSGKIVETERGLKPNFLKLTIDGQEPKFSDANKKNVDKMIEEKLVEIPFNVFCNTVTVSVNDFKSFVSLSPDDKRKIIDRIFGLSDINLMNELNKAEIKALNDEINMLETDIKRSNELLDATRAQLARAQQEIDANAVQEIEVIKSEIKELEELKERLKGLFGEVKQRVVVVERELSDKRAERDKTQNTILEITKKLALYAKGKCPHCLSDLTDDKHENINEKLKKMFEDYTAKLDTIFESIERKTEDLSTEQSEQNSIRDQFYDLDSKIRVKNSKISEIEAKLNSVDKTSQINMLIDQIETKISEASKRRFEAKEELQTNLELAAAFSNDGMKALLMSQIIPSINEKIQDRIAEIDYPFQFSFNEKFEVAVRHLGQEVEIEELSTGEKKEMNLITLFCVLDLMVMKSNLNFLFLDEVFTSLDRESIDKIIIMLRSFVDTHKMTVFAISHDPLPEEMFDTKLHIVKDKYWTDIQVS
jgi:DNA repair exonuclease SbcCD ATPase subunit